MKGILPETVRLRRSKTNFSHFRRQGLTRETDFLDEVKSNPVIAQLGYINLQQWSEVLTRFQLGLLNPWQVLRPPTYIDSPLSVEVWLRTCLPQFPKAYDHINLR